jgi:hypothetical protein
VIPENRDIAMESGGTTDFPSAQRQEPQFLGTSEGHPECSAEPPEGPAQYPRRQITAVQRRGQRWHQ